MRKLAIAALLVGASFFVGCSATADGMGAGKCGASGKCGSSMKKPASKCGGDTKKCS